MTPRDEQIRQVFRENGGRMTVERLTHLCLQAEVFSRSELEAIKAATLAVALGREDVEALDCLALADRVMVRRVLDAENEDCAADAFAELVDFLIHVEQ